LFPLQLALHQILLLFLLSPAHRPEGRKHHPNAEQGKPDAPQGRHNWRRLDWEVMDSHKADYCRCRNRATKIPEKESPHTSSPFLDLFQGVWGISPLF